MVETRAAHSSSPLIFPAKPTHPMPTPLPFTGERFVPGADSAKGEMWYEHWHRYHFVLPLVAGKKVLDVACGEGYGSALMSGVAALVSGIDISPEAIAHARHAYAHRANLQFAEAPCTRLPFDAAAFDVVVSFETIEHIREQAEFLDEVKRVLKADGVLILSSPNKAEYSDKRGYANEFHVSELYRAELDALLAPRFAHRRWLSQRNAFVSLIEEETGNSAGESLVVSQSAPDRPAAPLPALYHIVLAAHDVAALDRLPRRVSVFTDAEEWAYNDYRDTYKAYRRLLQREQELTARCAALQAEIGPQKGAAPGARNGESWLARFIRRLSG